MVASTKSSARPICHCERSVASSLPARCPHLQSGKDRSIRRFLAVIEAPSQEHRVVVYDRRLDGRSRSPMVVQTWDMVCDDMFGLMDTLSIDQAYLGGCSFGAGDLPKLKPR